jgi:hypothetical protein
MNQTSSIAAVLIGMSATVALAGPPPKPFPKEPAPATNGALDELFEVTENEATVEEASPAEPATSEPSADNDDSSVKPLPVPAPVGVADVPGLEALPLWEPLTDGMQYSPYQAPPAHRLPSQYTEYRTSIKRHYRLPQSADCYHPDWRTNCWDCNTRSGRFHHRFQMHSLAVEDKLLRCGGRDRCRIAALAAMSQMNVHGAVLTSMMGKQVSNANAAQMMLYHYDFKPESAELTPRGRRELLHRALALQQTNYPLVIESTSYEPELAEARRSVVLAELNLILDQPISEDRVIISEPLARGLDGVDAIRVQALMIQSQVGANYSAGASAGSGGALIGLPAAAPR